jgi:hypothetical protein
MVVVASNTPIQAYFPCDPNIAVPPVVSVPISDGMPDLDRTVARAWPSI